MFLCSAVVKGVRIDRDDEQGSGYAEKENKHIRDTRWVGSRKNQD